MTYLLDTNIWLERLLDRERAPEVARLLDQVPTDELSMTDFSLHSIGVILSRLHHADALVSFVQDVVIDGAVEVIALAPADMSRLVEIMGSAGLDFDDAYQYLAAENRSAVIVSFDKDFDGTARGRTTPAEVLANRGGQSVST